MKQFFLTYALLCLSAIALSQANTKLSNLVAPTAVNASLIPGTTNLRDLGSSTLSWKDAYLRGYLYLDGERFVSNAPGGGAYNTFIGANSALSLTTGKYNSTLGFQALYKNNTGSSNSAVGAYALYNNTYGYSNTAVGLRALHKNTTGFRNTGIGDSALFSNSSGYGNSAVGWYALLYNSTGYNNTALGNYALYYNSSSTYNTGVGYYSGNSISSTSTFLGAYASSGDFVNNATAIGYDAFVAYSNQIRLGNPYVTSIGGYAGWTNLSDGRFKQNIKQDVHGLDFINSLKPITYTVNVKGLKEYQDQFRKAPDGKVDAQIAQEEAKAEAAASKIVHSGFVAQEVEEATKKLGYAFNGVDKPDSKEGLYGLRYSDFVVPLVKAVQELSEKDKEIDELKLRIAKLEEVVNKLSNGQGSTVVTNTSSLSQNTPNPVKASTRISYTLPEGTSKGHLILTDALGRTLKVVNLNASGTVNLDATTLSSGTYNYSLVVDGKTEQTRKMTVIK
jgi:trimeric autotransporter adhesin